MGSYVGASWYSVAKVIFMINRTSQALYYNGREFVLGPIHDEDRYRASLEYLNRFYEEGPAGSRVLHPDRRSIEGKDGQRHLLLRAEPLRRKHSQVQYQ